MNFILNEEVKVDARCISGWASSVKLVLIGLYDPISCEQTQWTYILLLFLFAKLNEQMKSHKWKATSHTEH